MFLTSYQPCQTTELKLYSTPSYFTYMQSFPSVQNSAKHIYIVKEKTMLGHRGEKGGLRINMGNSWTCTCSKQIHFRSYKNYYAQSINKRTLELEGKKQMLPYSV